MKHPHPIHLALALGCTLGLATLAQGASPQPPTIHPEQWPARRHVAPLDPKIESFVDGLLKSMTLEEKVGQLVQADIDSVKPEDLLAYPLGSILAGGNAAPHGNVRASAGDWLALTDAFFRASLDHATAAHPAIPVIFGIDAVHGNARIPGATVFPHNVGLGAAHDPVLIEKIGRVTAEEVAAIGVDWTFAPTVAVVRDVRWGRSYESYSEDPHIVASYSRAMVTGLQGKPGTPEFMAPGHTLVSVKHFVGDGGTLDGRDQFDNLADEATLRDVHGAGYPPALDAGALIVMASYNSWQGTKMHGNHALLTDVLKGRWAFPGFIVGDWNAQEEIPGCTKLSCPGALNAGLDMYMAPDSWKQVYASLLQQARTGQVSASRVDDAVRRVLRVKATAGLFGKAAPAKRADVGAQHLGTAAHRAIARQAVRESLVLLKNNGHLLPLDPHAHVLVAGAGADDIGMQSGGWTIDWQGDHNTAADFPGGTSIYAGTRALVAQAGGQAVLSRDGSYSAKPDAAIVVFGETPYAEFQGDRENLDFSALDPQPLALLRRLHAAGIPVISVFLSGRPLWVNPEINASDAFVAAWLPGSEGGGVADLLFNVPSGFPTPEFRGRLAFSWPATAMPVRFGSHGSVSGAQFPRGYGLSLAASTAVPALPEDPQVSPDHAVGTSLFSAGHVTAPRSIYVTDRSAEVRLTMQSQPSPTGAVSAQLAKGAVLARWSGAGWGEFRIGGRAADLGPLAAQGMALRLHLRVDVPPTRAVKLAMLCEAPYGAAQAAPAGVPAPDWRQCGVSGGAMVEIGTQLAALKVGDWQWLEVPLACIAGPGAQLTRVSAPLALETEGQLALAIDEVRFAPTGAPAHCPASISETR